MENLCDSNRLYFELFMALGWIILNLVCNNRWLRFGIIIGMMITFSSIGGRIVLLLRVC